MPDFTIFSTIKRKVFSLWARFHYGRGMKHSTFLLLIFSRLKSKRAVGEAKKSIKQTKNGPFRARSGNES